MKHDNYVCLECKYRFNGLEEVAKHVKDKEHHEFRSLKYCATLKFDDVLKITNRKVYILPYPTIINENNNKKM